MMHRRFLCPSSHCCKDTGGGMVSTMHHMAVVHAEMRLHLQLQAAWIDSVTEDDYWTTERTQRLHELLQNDEDDIENGEDNIEKQNGKSFKITDLSLMVDEIIVTYIDEHVIDDDEKHKDAGLGMKFRFGLGMKARFGDGRKLPPKIIVFDPGIDLCGSRAENGSYTPTSTQLSIAFASGFGESIEGKPDTEYAMASTAIDGPSIEHIAIEVDNGNLELSPEPQ